jgi:hypothetical protein
VSGAEIVPFGKYKGQPIETLAADSDYCEWLIAQPWFSAKYKNVYNVVINYGAEPQDSPEHNQMQARFLNDEWCFQLADLLRPARIGTYGLDAARRLLNASACYRAFRDCCELEESEVGAIPRFEDRGWDVTYTVEPASIYTHRTRLVPPLPACSCTCDHADCYEDAKCQDGNRYCPHSRCGKRGIDSIDHCSDECYWSSAGPLTSEQRRWLEEKDHYYAPVYEGRIRVELKPDLGDDYPSVLRQVNGYPHDYGDKRCVVVRRYGFEHVTWEQVRKIFAASQVILLAESEIKAAGDPEQQGLALVKQVLGAEVVSE